MSFSIHHDNDHKWFNPSSGNAKFFKNFSIFPFKRVLSDHYQVTDWKFAFILFFSTLTAPQEKMLPTPSKFHYVFNLRDLSRIWLGMIGIQSAIFSSEDKLIQLWRHEITRVLADRFDVYIDCRKRLCFCQCSRPFKAPNIFVIDISISLAKSILIIHYLHP